MKNAIAAGLSKGETVLVIGATGFIGKQLVRLLIDHGMLVRVLSRRMHTEYENLGIEESSWIACDFSDPVVIRRACKGVSMIFHLANSAHVRSFEYDEVRRVNVRVTKYIKNAANAAGVRRLVYFSSVLADEPDSSVYAKIKLDAEKVLLDVGREGANDDLHVTILRPANVYGPGMGGNIGGLIRGIKNGRLPPLPALKNRLSLISVQDVCKAALMAAQGSQKSGQIYVLTDGNHYTPKRIEEAAYQALGREKPRWASPNILFFTASVIAHLANGLGIWNNDLGLRTYRNLVADKPRSCNKIKDDLGFSPTETLEAILPQIL